jgi:hypothetical protein
MRFFRLSLKIGVVVCSFSLMGCYVYDRAGGNLLRKSFQGATSDNPPAYMSGSDSKSSQVLDDDREPVLLPGSKSFPTGFQTF